MVKLRNRALDEINAQNAAAKRRSSKRSSVSARLSSKLAEAERMLGSPGYRGRTINHDISEETEKE